MSRYESAREHLFDEIKRLDLLLAAAVARLRDDPAYRGFDQYRGLFLTDAEIDTLLGAPPSGPVPVPGGFEAEKLARAALAVRKRTAAAARETAEAGINLPLERITAVFRLSEFDRDVLLLCLAPELSRKYERLYAYIQNDVMRKFPSADLALELFCATLDEKLDARRRFQDSAPLMRRRLISLARGEEAWLTRPLRLERSVASWLLGEGADETSVRQPRTSFHQLPAPWWFAGRMCDLLDSGCRAILLTGAEGSGKRDAAEALALARGLAFLIVPVPEIIGLDPASLRARMACVNREALLHHALVCFEDTGLLARDEHERAAGEFLKALENLEAPCVLASARPLRGDLISLRSGIAAIEMPRPGAPERGKLWREAAPELDTDSAATLAMRYAMPGGRIARAADSARLAAVANGRAKPALEDYQRACRDQSLPRLNQLARKVKPIHEWNDLVLPPDVEEHLREVCAHVEYREAVLGDWSFERKLSLGRGLSALFAGAPGTGKTMAAEVIANTLQLDLWQIDLSTVVSKYIGETEKNLSRIFEEAADSGAILFFDEADAIFGKRSEVRDSHDRYANIEINYLLQRMEQYEGFVILASNFMKNIDEAFRRRVRFVVEFPLPDEDLRLRIWRGVFPSQVPISSEADFPFLAHKFKISGGSIRNIALSAAFLAAQDSGVVGMTHLIRATRRELQKLGRLCVRADFDHYFDIVEPEEASA